MKDITIKSSVPRGLLLSFVLATYQCGFRGGRQIERTRLGINMHKESEESLGLKKRPACRNETTFYLLSCALTYLYVLYAGFLYPIPVIKQDEMEIKYRKWIFQL